MPAHEGFKLWHLFVTAGGTAVVQRILTEAVTSMPPLPDIATWDQKWIYALAHAIATPVKSNGNGAPKP